MNRRYEDIMDRGWVIVLFGVASIAIYVWQSGALS